MKRGSLKAADRNGALHELTAQGLVPLSVTEGMAKTSSSVSVKPVHVIAGLVLVLAVAVALFFLFPDKQTKKIVPKKGAPSTKTAVAPKQRSNPTVTNNVVDLPSNKVVQSTMNHSSNTTRVTQGDETVQPELPDPATNKPPRLFSTTTEQVISWIANTVPGNTPPPLIQLPITERTNIVAILNSDILLYDEDSEKVVEIKYNVAHAKQMLKDYLAKGGKTEDFLAFYHKELWSSHNEWRETQKKVLDLHKAGDGEGAVKYFMEQNKVLQAKGIKPVMLPPALNHLIKLEEEPGQQ